MAKKDKKTIQSQASTSELDYAIGYAEGLASQMWICDDCGNRYEYTVDFCPNEDLHKAMASVQHHRYRSGV